MRGALIVALLLTGCTSNDVQQAHASFDDICIMGRLKPIGAQVLNSLPEQAMHRNEGYVALHGGAKEDDRILRDECAEAVKGITESIEAGLE